MASCVQGAAILALDKYDKGSLGMDWNTIWSNIITRLN